jgi:hypothetical protein
MPANQAVSPELLRTIYELQELPSLSAFRLAGGTNLALRFEHRQSVDIDLFSNEMIGFAGFEIVQSEIEALYSGNLIFSDIENAESGDQYCFLKALIIQEEVTVKVEIIQNVPLVDLIEIVEGIRMATVLDIGLLKLMSICSRKAIKDLYDLDLITDNGFNLGELMDMLAEKEARFNEPENEWLFDLDDPQSPVENSQLLLEVDNIDYTALPSRPNHSNDVLNIISPNKTVRQAKASWRGKVRKMMWDRGIKPPPVRPVN